MNQLGVGGMGAVYRCESTLIEDIQAAVKVLLPHHMESSRDRFLREVRSVYSLRHTSVIHIRGFGEDPSRKMLWLAMELIEGAELSDTIYGGGVSQEEAIQIMYRLSDGLAHCHENGVFHRDLKPANILMRGSGVPVILDFGIAGEEGRTRLTKTGSVTGTPSYMAPEIFTGDDVSPAMCDVYALGQIFYELLIGRAAFPDQDGLSDGQRVIQVMGKKMHGGSLDPGDEFSECVRALVRASTHPDPKKRIQSAEALVMNCAFVLDELQVSMPEAAVRIDSVRRSVADGSDSAWRPPGLGGVDTSTALGTINFDLLEAQEAFQSSDAAPSDAPVGVSTGEVELPRLDTEQQQAATTGIKALIAVLGVIILVLLGVLVSGVLGGDSGESPSDSELATASAEAPPPGAAEPAKEAPAEEAEANAEEPAAPEKTHSKEENPIAKAPVAAPQPAAAAAPAPRAAPKLRPAPAAPRVVAPAPVAVVAPAPVEAVATRPITFSSKPMGAEVYVDGQLIGKTPKINVQVAEGQRTIVFSLDGVRHEKSISVGRRAASKYTWDKETDVVESKF